MDFPERADDAFFDLLHYPSIAGSAAISKQVSGHLRLAGNLENPPSFIHPVSNGLVHQNVLALVHCRDRNCCMKMIGRHYLDRVYILFFL